MVYTCEASLRRTVNLHNIKAPRAAVFLPLPPCLCGLADGDAFTLVNAPDLAVAFILRKMLFHLHEDDLARGPVMRDDIDFKPPVFG